MAVVTNYMKEEQQRINNQKNSTPTYGGNYSPVSAQKKAATPQVTQPAVVYTAGVQPQNYVSRYQPALDSILAQIQNPDAFKYEFNGDELFKSYADQYTQRGKQAMLDTMGQATGLTGGYGNSYAQQVGQQTYQNYLLGLYDKGLDLRNAAYGQYQDELGNLKDTYNAYMAAEQADYGRYTDALQDWRNQLAYEQQLREFEENKRRYDQEWAYKLQQDALAAAESGSSGRGGTGGGKGVVQAIGGKYYEIGSDNVPREVSEKEALSGKYQISEDLSNANNAAKKVTTNAMTNVVQTLLNNIKANKKTHVNI